MQKAVIDALQEFIELNQIDAIFMKDQYFNAINLCEGLPPMLSVRNKYLLERNPRLDFHVNRRGVVQQDKFYVLRLVARQIGA